MKKLHLSILLLLVFLNANAQFRFGAELAINYVGFTGTNDLDSIRVEGTSSNQGELFFTVFAENTIRKNVELLTKVSIKQILPGFIVYNSEATCLFCPVQKATVVSVVNLSIEVLPQLNIPIVRGVKSKIFAGPILNFNFDENQPDISFNGKHEGVADVINALNQSVKPFGVAFVYGGSIEFKNIVASTRVQLNSEYTKTINVWGNEYDFKNSWRFITFSLGYTFQTKKNKEKY